MDESDGKVMTGALLVLAGAILGAGVALLLAPQSGKDTRHREAFPAVVEADSWQGSKRSQSSLPASITSFIGRGKEVSELCGYLREENTRLVTLIGPPGIGKTRLSIEAARAMISDFADGIFLIALAPIEDPALVTSAIVEGLGYTEARDPQPLKHLTRGIGERCILLVLDNCEHVIEAVAPLVAELLTSCPRLKILTTSRESLRVQGEWLYSLPPKDKA